MRLIVVRDDGLVEEAVDDIEDYDLDKAIAKESVISDIKAAITRISKAESW